MHGSRCRRQAARRHAGGASHAAGAVLRRSRRSSSARWRRCSRAMWICAGRAEQVARPGQFFVREVARREHHHHAQRRRHACTRSTTSAGTAARSCAPSRRDIRRQHPVPVSRLDLRPRRTPDRRAAHGRGAALPQGGLPAAPRPRRRLGRAHLHQSVTRTPAPLRDAARRPAGQVHAPGAWRTCGSATASSTTSRRTGS